MAETNERDYKMIPWYFLKACLKSSLVSIIEDVLRTESVDTELRSDTALTSVDVCSALGSRMEAVGLVQGSIRSIEAFTGLLIATGTAWFTRGPTSQIQCSLQH